ncbi:glycosyltransferase family 2 protein [Novibacillus thermophilus]|uniref:Glycosyl transferase n=1 Tax=Novibacillus thermophilus TaxID=1471761 RepID=A0A1U9KAN3_9BACL|nr:glycosyltransferase family 2 protein [Novibacillus thermophilus]AQS57127.1 glycosyl transferase [Novibacillus thermophilus]
MSADLVFSLLLVVRNEMGYIRRVLESILHQDFPQQQYEIIVVDGYSTDRTPAIVQTYQTRYPGRIQYIKNPQQTLPSGWNIGIRHAKGDYVIRVDGHSDIPFDFLSKTYEVIQRVPEADCVGGVIQTEGEGFWGEVNAYVYSHPFGVGNSKFRITKNRWEGYVDTVPYGAYRRELFQEIGLFDESLKRNEDLEMHARIRNNGGRFFLSTEIRSTYFVRNTLGALLKKSFGDGKWTMVASRRGTGVLRWRHKMPLLAFLTGCLLLAGSFFSRVSVAILLALVLAYACLLTVSSAGLAMKKGARYFVPCMLAFFLLHFSRGIGSAVSLVSKDYWRKKRVYETEYKRVPDITS